MARITTCDQGSLLILTPCSQGLTNTSAGEQAKKREKNRRWFAYYGDFTVLVILTFKGVRVLNPCVYRGLRCTPQGVRVW